MEASQIPTLRRCEHLLTVVKIYNSASCVRYESIKCSDSGLELGLKPLRSIARTNLSIGLSGFPVKELAGVLLSFKRPTEAAVGCGCYVGCCFFRSP